MQQKVNDRLRSLQVADSILDSWVLLLPPEKKQVMSQKGDIDELLFQAHLLIHVYVDVLVAIFVPKTSANFL